MKLRLMKYLCVSGLAMGFLGGCASANGMSSDDSGEHVGQESAPIHVGGSFRLRNYKNPLECAGVAADNAAFGTKLVPWTCNGKPSQRWSQGQLIDPGPPPGGVTVDFFTQLVSGLSSGMCMSTSNTNNGGAVDIENCAIAFNQAWRMLFVFNATLSTEVGQKTLSCYKIDLGTQDGQVLAVARGDVRNNGGDVIHWPWLNNDLSHLTSPDQIWCVDNS